MKMTDTQNGFYCNTEALNKTERERYNQLTGKLATARVETKELPDGYAFRLKSEVIALSEVAEWISWERKCCPFFGFEIALERHNGPLWLKLRGTDGVKIFIRAEFHIGSRPSGQTEHRTRNLLRDRQAVRPSVLSIRNSLGQHSFSLRRPDTYRIHNS
jgi:hypothetical protein